MGGFKLSSLSKKFHSIPRKCVGNRGLSKNRVPLVVKKRKKKKRKKKQGVDSKAEHYLARQMETRQNLCWGGCRFEKGGKSPSKKEKKIVKKGGKRQGSRDCSQGLPTLHGRRMKAMLVVTAMAKQFARIAGLAPTAREPRGDVERRPELRQASSRHGGQLKTAKNQPRSSPDKAETISRTSGGTGAKNCELIGIITSIGEGRRRLAAKYVGASRGEREKVSGRAILELALWWGGGVSTSTHRGLIQRGESSDDPHHSGTIDLTVTGADGRRRGIVDKNAAARRGQAPFTTKGGRGAGAVI